MELRTTKEIAARLRVTETAAKRLLKRLGVKPFPLGAGRGLGDRWDLFEVDEAVRTLRPQEPEEPTRKIKPAAPNYFDGPCPQRLTKTNPVQ